MKFYSNWSDVVNPVRREIVFEERNKAYGAYSIRRDYLKTVLLSFLFSVFSISFSLMLPAIVTYFTKSGKYSSIKITDRITLDEPPPIDKSTPPPPVVVQPPPLQQTIKFTPPKIVKDEEVEEPPPTQEEVLNTRVGTQTQEGSNDVVDLPSDPVVAPEEESVFTFVEEMPTFPGGERKLSELLARIHYPTAAKENGISGYVYIAFIIDKDGKVKDASILKGIGGGCDQEALRVVEKLPEWKPGRQNGRNVAVRYTVRVNFSLQ